MQGDTTSTAARRWIGLLARSGPFEDDAERARAMLASWDANLLPESGAALLYGYFRREIGRALFEPIMGEEAWSWLTAPEVTTTHAMISRWIATIVFSLHVSTTTPDGRPWNDVLPEALHRAWQAAVARCGPDAAAWRWDAKHATNAQHPLTARFPAQASTLNPPRVTIGGDGDTIQAASYLWGERPGFEIVGLSVYRQVVDLADVAHGSSVIPGGVSGRPASPYVADQLEHWRTHRRIPMPYTPADIAAAAVQTLTILPA
ncbi:MAG: penicillin acylase family protein [Chloroflexota bacterium]